MVNPLRSGFKFVEDWVKGRFLPSACQWCSFSERMCLHALSSCGRVCGTWELIAAEIEGTLGSEVTSGYVQLWIDLDGNNFDHHGGKPFFGLLLNYYAIHPDATPTFHIDATPIYPYPLGHHFYNTPIFNSPPPCMQ